MLFVQVRAAAVLLQAYGRGAAARRQLAHAREAATTIQSAFRMHSARAALRRAVAAAVVIQVPPPWIASAGGSIS